MTNYQTALRRIANAKTKEDLQKVLTITLEENKHMNTIQQHAVLEWTNEYWYAIDSRDCSLLCEVLASHNLPCTFDHAERLIQYTLYERT